MWVPRPPGAGWNLDDVGEKILGCGCKLPSGGWNTDCPDVEGTLLEYSVKKWQSLCDVWTKKSMNFSPICSKPVGWLNGMPFWCDIFTEHSHSWISFEKDVFLSSSLFVVYLNDWTLWLNSRMLSSPFPWWTVFERIFEFGIWCNERCFSRLTSRLNILWVYLLGWTPR